MEEVIKTYRKEADNERQDGVRQCRDEERLNVVKENKGQEEDEEGEGRIEGKVQRRINESERSEAMKN